MSEVAGAADAALRIHGTDFLAAQADNRRKTWILIVLLILLGYALGYVIGWALEAWGGHEYGGFDLFAVSRFGLSVFVLLDSLRPSDGATESLLVDVEDVLFVGDVDADLQGVAKSM